MATQHRPIMERSRKGPAFPQNVTQGVEKPIRGASTKTDRGPMSTPHYSRHIKSYSKGAK